MNRFIQAMAAGLLATQALATVHVYRSNLDLFRKLTTLRECGYRIVPNGHVLRDLESFGTAMAGALFLTLTVGVGISFLALLAAGVWDRAFSRRTVFLVPFLLVWAAGNLWMNRNGFVPIVSAYFIVVPLVVFPIALTERSRVSRRPFVPFDAITWIPMVLLVVLSMIRIDGKTLSEFRDRVLLSNPLGERVVSSYYRYTLYPAEAVKTLDQKTLRTANIESIREEGLRRALEEKLSDRSYLNTGNRRPADLALREQAGNLVFEHREREILRVPISKFLESPDQVLTDFSDRTDLLEPFRRFAWFSIRVFYPMACFLPTVLLMRRCAGRFLTETVSRAVVSLVCLFAVVAIFLPLNGRTGVGAGPDRLEKGIGSGRQASRVEALKLAERNGIGIENIAGWSRLLSGTRVLERYWLARALGISHGEETFQGLLRLVDDPNPSVASMAYLSLGRRADRRAVPEILKRLEISGHWYSQMYAYNALMALGWRQTASIPQPSY